MKLQESAWGKLIKDLELTKKDRDTFHKKYMRPLKIMQLFINMLNS